MKGSQPTMPSGPQPALIFIPDISGFTQFVADTEISHAQHIIEELLSTVLSANEIGLEVSEVEGDAILFYRFGEAPSADQLLSQVKTMFTRFHQHLQKYQTHRVCNCGACKTAQDLTLKFVAHYGSITINQVQQFKKLFGKEVITAHRLLKNDIDSHEYALFTQSLISSSSSWSDMDHTAWSSPGHAEQVYDSGPVSYTYFSMERVKEQIPNLKMEDYSIRGYKSSVLETQAIIEAPIDLVFNVICDLPWRAKWIPGALPKVEEINSFLTQSGQTHKCLANGPVIVGHDYHLETDRITFTETDTKKTYCVVYNLQKMDGQRTMLHSVCYMPKSIIKETMFSVFMKKKFTKVYQQAWNNLNQYCIGLMKQKADHPYHIKTTVAEAALSMAS